MDKNTKIGGTTMLDILP